MELNNNNNDNKEKMVFHNFNTISIVINTQILITPTFHPNVRIEIGKKLKVKIGLKIESENWIFQMYVSDARTPMPSLYTCHPYIQRH